MNNALFSSNRDDWETPQAFFGQLDGQFHFTLDACASAQNAKCDRFFTEQDDGLSQSWAGETVFCNPPYSRRGGKTLGSPRRMKSRRNLEQPWSCSSQLVPIQNDSTNTYQGRPQKYDSYRVGYASSLAASQFWTHTDDRLAHPSLL